MSAIEQLATKFTRVDGEFVAANQLSPDYYFVDADTLASTSDKDDNGNPLRYRLKGIDAPEITKIFGPNAIAPGTVGGATATTTLQNLAREQGFTNVVKTGEFDDFGREIIDLQDDAGRSWERMVISSGVLDPNRYTSNEALRSLEVAKVFGSGSEQKNDWDLASDAISQAIEDETIYEAQFRTQALNEVALEHGYGYAPGSVMFRHSDRDLRNKATNPLSTAWDVGLTGAIEGLYGALDLVGDATGWEWADNVGEAGIYRARQAIKAKPEIITSYKDVDAFWGKSGALQYIANNAAISLPYMATSILGAVAAPATGGLSMTAPAALYAGTVYNEMEGDNKNPALAVTTGIAQAVLDRVGLSFLAKGTLLTKEGRDQAVKALIKSKKGDHVNIKTADQAKDYLLRASRAETAALATDAAKFAKQQIGARNVARTALKKVGVGGLGEAGTEAIQEGIGYTAAHAANNFRDWDANEFNDRLIEASIAGGTLGGAFSVPGTLYDYGAWVDVAHRKAPDDMKRRSWAGNKAKQDIAERGVQFNVQDQNIAAGMEANATDPDLIEDLNQRVDREMKRRRERTVMQAGADLWRAIPGLWRGLTRQAFDEDLQNKSTEARVLGESVGSNLQRSTSGATYENRKHHLITEVRNMMGGVDRLLAAFDRNDKRSSRIQFSEEYYTAYQRALAKAKSEGREINWDTDLEGPLADKKAEFIAFNKLLRDVGDRLHSMQAVHNKDLGYIFDYLSKFKSINKEAVEANQAGFEAALMQEYNMNPDQAKEVAEAILNMDGVASLDDAFSVTDRKKFKPGSHKKRDLGLSEREAFAPFMENDLFTNISNAAKSAVRYTVLEEYVGSDNKKLNYRLAKIEKELIQSGMGANEAKARVDALAKELKDYFDAESGNYKRLNNPVINWVQKNLLFVTTITGLPLAVISNFVEAALVFKGMTVDQIFGKGKDKDGSLNSMARAFVDEIGNTATRAYGAATNMPTPHKRDSGGHAVAKDLGFFDWEVGAAHTTGVSETGHWRQKILDMYFKVILLQQWTNATRASRAAIAGDFITDHLSVVIAARNTGVFTNEAAEAEEAIRNLGIDVEFMMNYISGKDADGNPFEATEERNKLFDDFMRDATFNFVNEAVAMPQAANRPKIFQDPRFAFFTQFQGFIATFTANHIPKMWGEYVKRGTPAMKYNIFATMSTMILLGFVSQHLKDLLKYGKTTPYFSGAEYIRRGVGASGLLGTGERVIDFVFPMYEERYKTNIGWAFGTVSGESAALSKALRLGGLGVDVATGEKTPGYAAVRISPLVQAIHQQTKDLPQWGFGGPDGN